VTTVLGADGCRGGAWVVAELSDELPHQVSEHGGLRWHLAPDAAALLALQDELRASALAVDVPIGLPEAGLRRCDVEARRVLRGGGASSVFAAPTRPVLAALDYGSARAGQPSLSAQAFGLVARIRDVDDALRAAGADVHDRVVECHPEVAFRRLTGRPLPRKKSAPGALERLRALTAELGPPPPDAPPQAALDDALDALACAWTARRWSAGRAEVLGGGETDGLGLPMRIVA
jgi:predicted RNase H-like nuclease